MVSKNFFFNHCWNKIKRQDSGAYFLFFGQPRSGKSTAALSLCEKLHFILTGKPFPIINVVYSLSDFAELLDNGNLKPGSCIIFDEAAGSADSGITARGAMTRENKDFVSLITTIGERKLVLFYVAPKQSQLDSLVRTVGVHGRFLMKSIDRNRNLSSAEFAWVHSEPANNYVGYPKPRIGKDSEEVERVWFNLPKKELMLAYKEKKKMFLSENVRKINLAQKKKLLKGKDKEVTLKKIVDLAVMGVNKFYSVNRKGVRFVDPDLIRVDFEIPFASAKSVAKAVEKRIGIT